MATKTLGELISEKGQMEVGELIEELQKLDKKVLVSDHNGYPVVKGDPPFMKMRDGSISLG